MKKITFAIALCAAMGANAQNQINLPINWEGTTTNYTVTDFGGNASSVVVDPTLPGNMVLKSDKTAAAQFWAGTTLSTPAGLASAIPFSAGNTVISVKVWSPDAGIVVRLKAEVAGTPSQSVETDATTTVANGWQTLEFDFSNQVAGTAPINFAFNFNMLSIFYNFGVDGATAGLKTYYCDDIMFGTSGPTLMQVDLPITFDDDSTDYDLVSFGGAIESIVVDPTDPNNKVLKQEKPAGAQTWGGTVLGDGGLANAIPFAAGSTFMTARVWAVDAGTPVLMKVENVANGAVSVETFATTTVAGAWETLLFDFTNNAPGTPALDLNAVYGKVVIFCDFGNAGSGKTFYVDNVKFGSNIGVEENAALSEVSIYPNPSNGIIHISGISEVSKELTIRVTDVNGRVLSAEKVQATGVFTHSLDLTGLAKGMYLVNITSNSGTTTQKVMIAH